MHFGELFPKEWEREKKKLGDRLALKVVRHAQIN